MIFKLFTLFLVYSFTSIAGDTKGNGGGAWVCFSPSGNIEKVMVLDLVEGLKSGLRFNEEASAEELEEDIRDRLVELNDYILPIYLKAQKDFFNHESSYEKDLPTTSDHGNITRPEADWCANGEIVFKQVMTYLDSGEILINQPIYEKLSTLDKKAIHLHEAIYSLRRKILKDVTSETSRRIVALLLAKNELSLKTKEELNTYLYPDFNPARTQRFTRALLRYSTPIEKKSIRYSKWSCQTEFSTLMFSSFRFEIGRDLVNITGSIFKRNGIGLFREITSSRLIEKELVVREHEFTSLNTFIKVSHPTIESILLRSNGAHQIVIEFIAKDQVKNSRSSQVSPDLKVLGEGFCTEDFLR